MPRIAPRERSLPAAYSRRKAGALVFSFVLIGSLVAVLLSYAEPAASYESRGPIVIDDDSDFLNDAVSGVRSGAGSPGDPYIISDWEIIGSGGDGISVQGTTKHFVITNVHVNSTYSGGWLEAAVRFVDVSNGSVEDSIMNETTTGIIVHDSDNITLDGNTIADCSYGITLGGFVGVEETAVLNNTLSSGYEGISLTFASRCQVEGNIISSFLSYGVYAYWSVDVSYSSNNVSDSDGLGGIYLDSCTDCVVYNNTLDNNNGWDAGGLSLYSCSRMLSYHNSFFDNTPEQAYDYDGTGNRWNSTAVIGGNYWNDWTSPDDDHDGIVDDPYTFDVSAQDNYPLTTSPGSGSETPIPEFTTVVVPALAVLAVFLLVRRRA